MNIKTFKDFEGDELNIQVTSVVFIDVSKTSLVYTHKEAKELAEWLLKTIAEKENQGITVDKV